MAMTGQHQRVTTVFDLTPTASSRSRCPDLTAAELTTLCGRAAVGDTVAFAELYDATVKQVYGLVLQIVGHPYEAEKVTQESYLELWHTAAAFDSRRGTVISWVLMTTRGVAVQALSQPHPHLDPIYDVANGSRDTRRTLTALVQLATVQREALELACVDGCTHSEVATRLALPSGAAKSQIRDGLLRLRDLLNGGEPPAATKHESSSAALASPDHVSPSPVRTDRND